MIGRSSNGATLDRPLVPRKGRPYNYRLIRALPGQTAADEFVVDLGFHNQGPGRLEGIENRGKV